MRRKKIKGRKIYKTKEKNYLGKSPAAKFMSGALTVLLIGGIGFLGYSVAEPVINYTRHEGDDIPAEATIPEDATAAVTTTATAADMGNFTPVQVSTVVTTAAVEEKITSKTGVVLLKPADLASAEKLDEALKNAAKNAETGYIYVPLKTKGGEVYYSSALPEIQNLNIIKSPLRLDEIVLAVLKSKMKPVAVVSALDDSLFAEAYPEAGYVIAAGGAPWLDEKKNKPCTSPYSKLTLDYLNDVVGEVSAAGFEKVVCTDIAYPEFTKADLAVLEESFSSSNRFMVLASTANLLHDKAVANGSTLQIEVTAKDVLSGRAEVLQPMLLTSNNILLDLDLDALIGGVAGEQWYDFSGTAAENADKCMGVISEKLSEFNVTVHISGKAYKAEELDEAKKKVAGYGYEVCVIG